MAEILYTEKSSRKKKWKELWFDCGYVICIKVEQSVIEPSEFHQSIMLLLKIEMNETPGPQ